MNHKRQKTHQQEEVNFSTFALDFLKRKQLMEDTAVTQVVYLNALINFQDYRLQHRVRFVLSEITENYSRYTLMHVFKIKVIEYELTFPQNTKDLKNSSFLSQIYT